MKPVNQKITNPKDLRPDDSVLHTGIWADTGGGKTFLMNEVHKYSPNASILVAQPKDNDDYELYGEKIRSKADLKKKLEAKKKIHFNPPTNSKDFMKEILSIYEVCQKANVDTVEMYIDEFHRLLNVQRSKEIDMTADDFITDARGNGVRVALASQSLNRFKNDKGRLIVGSCGMHIFLGVNKMQKGFYDFYNFPYEDMKYLNQDIYQYAGVRYNGSQLSGPFRLKT
jgi:hypothetical protein